MLIRSAIFPLYHHPVTEEIRVMGKQTGLEARMEDGTGRIFTERNFSPLIPFALEVKLYMIPFRGLPCEMVLL